MIHTVLSVCLCAWANVHQRRSARRLDFKEQLVKLGGAIFHAVKNVESSRTVRRRRASSSCERRHRRETKRDLG